MAEHEHQKPYVRPERKEALRICAGMLIRLVDVVEGCHRLTLLRRAAGIDEWDTDFSVFAHMSEVFDRLGAREGRRYWSEEEVAKAVPDGKDIVDWARAMTAESCRSVKRRVFAEARG